MFHVINLVKAGFSEEVIWRAPERWVLAGGSISRWHNQKMDHRYETKPQRFAVFFIRLIQKWYLSCSLLVTSDAKYIFILTFFISFFYYFVYYISEIILEINLTFEQIIFKVRKHNLKNYSKWMLQNVQFK